MNIGKNIYIFLMLLLLANWIVTSRTNSANQPNRNWVIHSAIGQPGFNTALFFTGIIEGNKTDPEARINLTSLTCNRKRRDLLNLVNPFCLKTTTFNMSQKTIAYAPEKDTVELLLIELSQEGKHNAEGVLAYLADHNLKVFELPAKTNTIIKASGKQQRFLYDQLLVSAKSSKAISGKKSKLLKTLRSNSFFHQVSIVDKLGPAGVSGSTNRFVLQLANNVNKDEVRKYLKKQKVQINSETAFDTGIFSVTTPADYGLKGLTELEQKLKASSFFSSAENEKYRWIF